MTKRPIRTVLKDSSLAKIGIPKEMRSMTINDFMTFGESNLISVKEFATDYINNIGSKFDDNISVFLFGGNGTGKTLTACMILIEAYRKRFTVKRCTFAEYIVKYTEGWGSNLSALPHDNLFENYTDVEFLVLEEVGKEIESKIASPVLESLLRYREEKGYPTIICTNLNLKAFEDRYGASIISLIKGNFFPVKIEGKDRRQELFEKRLHHEEQ